MIQKSEIGEYWIKDISGNEVIISSAVARELYETLEREDYKEDILMKLEAVCEDENLDINKISDALIEEILNEYGTLRYNDESWSHDANTAIDVFIDDIREEGKPAENKENKRESVERD